MVGGVPRCALPISRVFFFFFAIQRLLRQKAKMTTPTEH